MHVNIDEARAYESVACVYDIPRRAASGGNIDDSTPFNNNYSFFEHTIG